MAENVISFFNCCDTSQEKVITVEQTVQTAYTYLEQAARRLTFWITVDTAAVIRTAVRTYRRLFCAAKAFFKCRVFIRQGGLRL